MIFEELKKKDPMRFVYNYEYFLALVSLCIHGRGGRAMFTMLAVILVAQPGLFNQSDSHF